MSSLRKRNKEQQTSEVVEAEKFRWFDNERSVDSIAKTQLDDMTTTHSQNGTTTKSTIDKFLSATSSYCANTNNIDKSLKLMSYLLWFLSKISSSNTSNGIPSNKISIGLRKLSAEISFTRYVLRFFGMPITLDALRNPESPFSKNKTVNKIMAYSMLLYYPLEYLAYAKWKAPELVPGKVNASWCSMWSTRLWMIYIITDMIDSRTNVQTLIKEKVKMQNTKKEKGNQVVKSKELNAIVHKIKFARLHLLRCALFTLPAVHWSLPNCEVNPWLREEVLKGLTLSESICCFYQSIF